MPVAPLERSRSAASRALGWVDRVRLRGDPAVGHGGQDLVGEGVDDGRELGAGADAERGADDPLPPEGDRVEVEAGGSPGKAPDADDPAPDRGRGGNLGEEFAADVVEGDGDAGAVGGGEDGGGEVLGAGVDRDVRAGLGQHGPFLLARGGRDDLAGTERLGELDADQADRAGAAGDEDAVAGGEPGLGDQRVVLGDQPDGQGGGLLEAESLGNRYDEPWVAQRVVGEGAGGDAHDPGSGGQVRCERAAGLDHAGDLHSGGELPVGLARGPVGAVERVEVGTVEARGHHLDPQGAEPGGQVVLAELPGAGAGAADECAHVTSPRTRKGRGAGWCRAAEGRGRRRPSRAVRARRDRA